MTALTPTELHQIHGFWRACNYLAAGMIYLQDNPLLREPLQPEHILNGYKINNPTILARISHQELEHLLQGYGYTPYFVEGDDYEMMHQNMAATLDRVVAEIHAIQVCAREDGDTTRPFYPAIVLRSPKGWTGPKALDGHQLEGSWRSHQVPLKDVKHDPKQLQMLVDWLQSYRPEELFDAAGKLRSEFRFLAPSGTKRMGSNPHANGGLLRKSLKLPDFRKNGVDVSMPEQSLLTIADRCFRSTDLINTIVSDKQPHLQYLTMDAAIAHCTKGMGIWKWASTDFGVEPDVVIACAGDIPTQEALAAVAILHEAFPELKIRFINVVDLLALQQPSEYPEGLTARDFDSLFTIDKPIIFNFHGYP